MFNTLEKFYELLNEKSEGDKWDYKEEMHLNPNTAFIEILKDILALGNSGGGWLVLGVNDDGEIKGIKEKIDITKLLEKIQTTLGFSINIELNYYDLEYGEKIFTVGLLYICDFEKIITSSKTYHNAKSQPVILMDTVYVRRNSSSRQANGEDLTRLIFKLKNMGGYNFSQEELELLERQKNYLREVKLIDEFLTGEYKFSAINFANKLNYIYRGKQYKYSKQEIGILLGLELDYLDDYFEGKRFPKLEHLLRAIEIFDLPHDYFFQTTYLDNFPFVYNPLVTHTILNKVDVDKLYLVNLGMGNVVKKVFNDLSLEFAAFKTWINLEKRYDKYEFENSPNTFFDNHIYSKYEHYLLELQDDIYKKFKEHLKVQFYKELEICHFTEERPLSEDILFSLCSSTTERVCKFLNETIKEIKLIADEIVIEYHFLDEIQKQVVRKRTYSDDNCEVNFIVEIPLAQLFEK